MPGSVAVLPKNVIRPATRVGFLLLPDFALMSYASAVEPLRAANRLAGRDLYAWRHISLDGEAATASNGASIRADHPIGEAIDIDVLFVCAGGNPARFENRAAYRWLRTLAHNGVAIGGVSGGAYLLARAGLLDGYRATIHWEHLPAFSEEFPASCHGAQPVRDRPGSPDLRRRDLRRSISCTRSSSAITGMISRPP